MFQYYLTRYNLWKLLGVYQWCANVEMRVWRQGMVNHWKYSPSFTVHQMKRSRQTEENEVNPHSMTQCTIRTSHVDLICILLIFRNVICLYIINNIICGLHASDRPLVSLTGSTLSGLNLPLSSSSTKSRELLPQFSTCAGWTDGDDLMLF